MFKFSLQRLLDLRARKEQEVATRFAHARTGADAAEREAAALEEAREAGRARMTEEARTPDQTAGLLQQMNYVLGQLDVHVVAARQQATAAETAAQLVQSELTVAFQDRRVLDRLRERQHDAWKSTESQLDRTAMDEIALSRFHQSDTKPAGDSITNKVDR